MAAGRPVMVLNEAPWLVGDDYGLADIAWFPNVLLLETKLFALCDRGTDLADCIALAPAAEELDEAEPWLAEQDANPMWPDHVRATLADLRRRLGHGL